MVFYIEFTQNKELKITSVILSSIIRHAPAILYFLEFYMEISSKKIDGSLVLFLLMGLIMIWSSKNISKPTYDPEDLQVKFRHSETIVLILAILLGIANCVLLYISWGMIAHTNVQLGDISQASRISWAQWKQVLVGRVIYYQEWPRYVIFVSSLKLILPTLSLVWSFASPYKIQASHLPLLRQASHVLSYITKICLICYVIFLSLKVGHVMSFFYLNTLVILIINMFRQSSKGTQFKNFRVTGYFQFILLATSTFLIVGSGLILVMDMDKYNQEIDKKAFLFKEFHGSVPDLIYLYLLSTTYFYMKNIGKMIDTVNTQFLIGASGDLKESVTESSLFTTYFIKQIGLILELNGNTLIDQKLKFKYKFLDTLTKESEVLKAIFDPMFEIRKKELSYWLVFSRTMYSQIKDMVKFFFKFVIARLKLVTIIIVSYYLIKLMTEKNLSQSYFQFSYLLWFIIHSLGIKRDDQIIVASYLVFPAFIFDQISSQVKSLQDYYRSEGKTTIEKYPDTKIYSIFFLMLYIFLVTYESQNKISESLTKIVEQSFEDNKKGSRNNSNRENIIEYNLNKIVMIFLPSVRDIALIHAVISGLLTINIPNSLLVLFSLILLHTKRFDEKHWNNYFCFNIFLILVLYISSIAKPYIHTLNNEVISMVGVYAWYDDLYIKRMESHIFTFYLIYLTNIANKAIKEEEAKRSRLGSISSPTEPELMKKNKKKEWYITRMIENTIEFSKSILNSYSIWIFHCFIHTMIFSTELNYMCITLYIAEAIIFPIQLYQWHAYKKNVYSSIYKSYIWLYRLIILNALYRYLTFFARFICIRKMVISVAGLLFSEKYMIFVFNKSNNKVDALYPDFQVEFVLLLFAFFTKYCITNNMRTESQDPTNVLKEKLIEMKKNNEERFVLLYRHTTTFTTVLLIFKGVTFLYMGYHTTTTPNAYKVLLMLAPLIYFNTLFIRIESSFREFRIRKMVEHYIMYFGKCFAQSVKKNIIRINSGIPLPEYLIESYIMKNRDDIHNEAYFFQFLKRMESDIVTLSNRFWPVFFYMWLFYVVLLMIIRILLDLKIDISMFFKHFGLFHDVSFLKMSSREGSILLQEQQKNQLIFIFLIIEFLVIHYYFSLPDNILVMPPTRSKQMVDMMENKIDFYLADMLTPIKEPTQKALLEREEKIKQYWKDYKKNVEAFENMSNEEISNYIKQISEDKQENRLDNLLEKMNSQIGREEKMKIGNNYDQSILEFIPNPMGNSGESRERASSTFIIDKRKALAVLDIKFNKYEPTLTESEMNESMVEETQNLPEKKADQKNNQLKLIVHMDEDSNSLMKVIFKERNLHTFSIARILNSVSYITTRFMVLPLLFSLGQSKSIMDFFFLLMAVAYIFRFKVVAFEDKMKLYIPIFSFIVFLESAVRFYMVLTNKTTKSPEAIDQEMKTAFYRFWLIGLACFGFASIIVAAKYVFTHLFIIKLPSSSIFFMLNLPIRKIEIDFIRWKHYTLSWSTWVINSLFIYLNDIYMTGVIIFILGNPNNPILLVIMLLLFSYSIFQRFKKQEITSAMEENAATILSLVIKIVVIFLFLLEFTIQILDGLTLLGRSQTNSEIKQGFIQKMKTYNVQYSTYMIIFSLLFFDLLKIARYAHEKHKLSQIKRIQAKYSDICEIQETNESKIYERVLIMMANDRLQNQIDHYLKKGIINSIADLNYHKTDIKVKLRDNRYTYLSMFLEPIKVKGIQIVEDFYVNIVKNTNHFHDQDILYLLTKVCQFDRGIVNSSDLDLTDYLSGDYSMFEMIFTEICSFYANLYAKEKNEYEVYKNKLATFEEAIERNQDETSEFSKENIPQPSEETPASIAQTPSDLIKRFARGGSYATVKSSSFNMDESNLTMSKMYCALPSRNKKNENHVKAAIIMSGFLLNRKSDNLNLKFQTMRNSALFKMEEEDAVIVFHNIQLDNLKSSSGFMRLNSFVLLNLIKTMFWTKIEAIISYIVIFVLYLNGGVLSAIIIGILFFRVLVEEKGGRLIWWDVVNLIYFIQFALSFLSGRGRSPDSNKDGGLNFDSIIYFLCGKCDNDINLKMNAVSQVLILWLVQFIKNKIINQPEGKAISHTGVAIARVA